MAKTTTEKADEAEIETTEAEAPDTAAEAEATGADHIKVVFDGVTYLLPGAFEDWPVEAEVELERGHDALATEALLGPTQWALFVATGPTVRKRRDLVASIMKAFNSSGN